MKKGIHLLLIAMVISSVMIATGNHASASNNGAEKFVKSISTDVLKLLKDKSLSESKKEKKLNDLFENVVDIPWIGKFVAGRYWRTASKEQRADYLKYYNQFLKQSYVTRFKSYTNQKINLKKVIKQAPNEYLVETEIISDNAQPTRIDYKIRQTDNKYQVFDIVAEGVSLITTQRADFDSILARKGLSYLIGRLKAKVTAS